ncbi:MAG: hypothetical protein SGILL_007884, partial [Bacillariaceae sp.]
MRIKSAASPSKVRYKSSPSTVGDEVICLGTGSTTKKRKQEDDGEFPGLGEALKRSTRDAKKLQQRSSSNSAAVMRGTTAKKSLESDLDTKPAATAAAFKASGDNGDDVEFLGTQVASLKNTPHSSKKQRKTFRCAICIEDEIPGHRGLTLSCKHRFCKDCLKDLISSKVHDKATSSSKMEIHCPAAKCKTCLSTSEIQYILRDDRKAFDAFSTKAN